MRKLKIAFVDFWEHCDFSNHIITLALKKTNDVEIVSPDDADYVFYSVFGNEHWFVSAEKIKIFYTGENLCPDFNACDYAIGFDWIEIGDRYFRLPNYYATNFFYPKVELMQHKHEFTDEQELLNRKFCSFVVSNDAGNPIRRQIFERLSEYCTVDSGGRWMNNVGGPVDDKFLFDSLHKFSICFENSSHAGYTTEKIVEAFAAHTIPIYWGDPKVSLIFNGDAFVNVNEYDSMDEVVEKVKEIDNDNDLYIKMLKTPALLDERFSYQCQFDLLSDFLTNIISQPLDKAKRYNRDFWGKRYIERERNLIIKEKKGVKELLKERLKSRICR